MERVDNGTTPDRLAHSSLVQSDDEYGQVSWINLDGQSIRSQSSVHRRGLLSGSPPPSSSCICVSLTTNSPLC